MLTREECGRRLRAAREAAGLTQAEVAERLGMKRGSYAQYETGRIVPSWILLDKMIEVAGMDREIIHPECFPPGEDDR